MAWPDTQTPWRAVKLQIGRARVRLHRSCGHSPSLACSHLRTVRALSIVSAVVNVFDTTTTSVVSGSRPRRLIATSTGSTLAMKRSSRPEAQPLASGSFLHMQCGMQRLVLHCSRTGDQHNPNRRQLLYANVPHHTWMRCAQVWYASLCQSSVHIRHAVLTRAQCAQTEGPGMTLRCRWQPRWLAACPSPPSTAHCAHGR